MRSFIRRIYLLGLVFVLVGGLNTFVGIRHLGEQLQQHIEDTITFKLDSVMSEVSLGLLNVERMLGAAEAVIAIEDDEDKIIQFFDEILRDNRSFLAMYLGIAEDHVLYTNRDFHWEPVDPTTRPWYQAATREGRLVFTYPYVDAAADRWVITMAKPLYDENGHLMGVLGVDESLQGMLASLEMAKPSEHGHVFAFDEMGRVLLSDPEEVQTPVLMGQDLMETVLSDPGGILFTTVEGEDGYFRWQAVGSSGIIIGLFAPIKDFLDYRLLVVQVLLTTLVSLVVLALALFIFQRQYITKPMRDLDRDIMAISLDEDVTYRLPARKHSPFEHLRRSINVSLDRVQQHFENIIHQQEELTAAYGQLVAHEKQLQEQYQEIKKDEEHIQFLADHDVLTGLPNRRKFEEDLEALLDSAQTGSVLLFDLDNFKNVNDTLGHVYGDALLRHLAGTLERSLDSAARVYRFGGDEFLVILDGIVEREELAAIITRLLQNVSKTHTVEGRRNNITSSVGVVRYPYDGTSVEQLLIKADIAMYNAKQLGRNRYVLFEASMSASFAEQVHMKHILREAVKNGGFRLLYQPVVDARTGDIAYLEALIRLQDHSLSPTVFVAAAEESDLIQPMGRWVIQEAIGQLVAWRAEGKELKPISINLSPKQFYDVGLVDFLIKELETHQIDRGLIEMEITETVLIDSSAEAVRIIERIRKLGVKVALDDFGTGYLSIKYITHLPVDRIKLDRSMSQGLPGTLPVIEGLITIAHSLGMAVVAEGIEETEEAHQLVKAQCDYLQGYLFAQPLTDDEIGPMLGANFAQHLKREV